MSKGRVLTPQQELFLSNYLNPKSDTFSNATQSAIKAGYGKEYAENITHEMPDWLSENLGDMKRLRKAEKVLDEILEYPSNEPSYIKVKQDTAKFFAKALDKKKYSERQEHTGADGKDLIPPVMTDEQKAKLDELL